MASEVFTEDFYRRRIDRSPEKQEFRYLPRDDKHLISNLRTVMGSTKDKVSRLQDELEDRERDVDKETVRRRAAETRLDQLVEMYGDSSVTIELEERLPRASKRDYKIELSRGIEHLKRRGCSLNNSRSELNEVDGRELSNSKRSRSAEPEERYSSHYYEEEDVMDSAAFDQRHRHGRSHSPVSGHSNRRNRSSRGRSYSPPNTNLQYQGGLAHGVTNLNSASLSNPASGASAGIMQPVDGKDSVLFEEQNRHIAILVKELDEARSVNQTLQEKLAAAKKELETMKLSAETAEAAIRAEHSQKVTEMVNKIYKAQKERDEAMMSRLKIANEERDQALTKLRQKERGQEENDSNAFVPVGNIKNVLTELVGTDSVTDIRLAGGLLVNAIEARQSRRRDITTDEMKAVLEERDSSVAEAKKLEGEALLLKRQIRSKDPEKQQVTALQAKLVATQQERDMALAKVRKLEEELQNLKVFYSLHNSLSQEAKLRDDFNNTLENIETQVKQRDGVIDVAQKENSRLVTEMKALAEDKVILAEELQKAQATQKEADNNCERLERLVNVLRRKINGLGTKTEVVLD